MLYYSKDLQTFRSLAAKYINLIIVSPECLKASGYVIACMDNQMYNFSLSKDLVAVGWQIVILLL